MYVVGGQCIESEQQKDGQISCYLREDYILEKNKNKLKSKTRRIESSYNLDMPQGVVVVCLDHYYLYAIVYE